MLQQEERYEAIIIGSLMVSVGKETISPHVLLFFLKGVAFKGMCLLLCKHQCKQVPKNFFKGILRIKKLERGWGADGFFQVG
jgi:hypothetical protein